LASEEKKKTLTISNLLHWNQQKWYLGIGQLKMLTTMLKVKTSKFIKN
jgi:hypothetical protein